MILIVDSGSTKTDWIAINNKGEILFQTQTLGLNPQVLTDYIIEERIVNNFDLYQNRKSVTKLYFYGAGCGTEPPRLMIKGVFLNIFKNADTGPPTKSANIPFNLTTASWNFSSADLLSNC